MDYVAFINNCQGCVWERHPEGWHDHLYIEMVAQGLNTYRTRLLPEIDTTEVQQAEELLNKFLARHKRACLTNEIQKNKNKAQLPEQQS